MAYANYAAIVAAAVITMSVSTAFAAKKCNIEGSFVDSLGSSGQFFNQKKGTVSNTNICPTAYSLTVTKLTSKVIDVKGTSKTATCGALTGNFTFQNGGCTSASGTVTIQGLGSLADTITKTGNSFHRPPADTSMLSNGLK